VRLPYPWRRPNDVRIDCKAAKHSDEDRGALCAPTREWPRRKRAAPERDCSSAPIGARANKRRFVNLLQQLGRGPRHIPCFEVISIHPASDDRRFLRNDKAIIARYAADINRRWRSRKFLSGVVS